MRKQKQTTSHHFWHAFGFQTLVVIAAIAVLSLVRAGPARAAPGTNQQLNYQARLLTSQGAVVPDGLYNIEFKIYQDGNGVLGGGDETLKWTETRTGSNRVIVKNGYFSVYLGSVTAFGTSVDWNQDTLWLSVNVGGTAVTPAYDGEMSPYTRLSSTPYAINSRQLGGLTSDKFVQLAQNQQTDTSANASIHINDTGGGNFLHFLSGGVDKFTVSNSGTIAAATALNTINGIIINNGAVSGVTSLSASGDITTSGNIATTGTGTVTSAGLITASTGLTVTSGGLGVTGGIDNNSGGITESGSITGVGTNITATGALTVASGGSSGLTLDSASNVLTVAASDTTLQRVAAGSYTIDLSDSSTTSLILGNSGSATANLNLQDGGLLIGGTSVISSARVLENITGITSSGTITFSAFGAGLVQSSAGGVLTSGTVDRNSSTFFSSALNVANGGTGSVSFNSNGILIGNGTGGIQSSLAGSPGQVLLANASNVPTFTTLSGDVTIGSTGTTAIQPNSVVLATDTTGNYVATVTVGNGLTVSGVGSENATATLGLDVTVTGSTATTSALAGLETDGTGLRMLGGCNNGQVLKWQGTTTGWQCNNDNTFSDSNVKTNVATHGSVLNSIKNIRVVDYNYKCNDPLYTHFTFSCDSQTGVLAQELLVVFPELVTLGGDGLYRVNYNKLGLYSLKAVSELAAFIDASGNASFTNISTGGTQRLTSGGALQNITGITVNGTSTLTGASTLSGGTINLNNNSTSSVNINTGTSTGTTTIGNTLSTLIINSSAFKVTSGGAVSGVSTLSASGNITTTSGGIVTGALTRLTNGGALQNITGLTVVSGGASISGATSISGGTIDLNAGGILTNTNINTGSSTGTVTIGGGLASLVINSTAFDVSSSGAVSGVTTLTASGNISTTGVYVNDGLSGVSAGTCASNNYLGGLRVTGGIVTAAGTCNGVGLSDERLKDNIVELNSTLPKVKDINLVTFDFKCDHDAFTVMNETCKEDRQTGVLAQQLATVFPELVYEDEFGYMRVKYDALNIYTLRAVQDLAGMLRIEGGKLVLDTRSQNGFSVLGSGGEELFALDADGNAVFSGNVSGGNTVTPTNVLAAIDQRLQEFRLSSQTFSGVVAFSNDVNFANFVRFAEDVEYAQDVYFKGRPIFNNDTAGFAVIEPGDTEVKVTFSEPYSQVPVVNVSNTNGNYTPYTLTDIDETGFTIKVQLPVLGDVKFNWTAFVADQAVTYLSGENPED